MGKCIICNEEIKGGGKTLYCSYICQRIAAAGLTKENIHICLNCGIKFIDKNNKQFCKRLCEKEYIKKQNEQYNLICQVCKNPFMSNNKHKTLCSKECEEINEKPFINYCDNCNKEFRSITANEKFCCVLCRKEATKQTHIIKKINGSNVNEIENNKTLPTYSEGEKLLYNLITILFNDCEILYRQKYNWLPSPESGRPLELDIYIPSINLAFEYDGGQHNEYNEYIHKTKKNFIEMQNRDKFKDKKCAELGITLIRFDDRTDYVQRLTLIKKLKTYKRQDIIQKYFL